MPNKRFISRLLSEIEPISTSHSIGMKQVLLANADTCSSITQIAVTTLRKGESVDIHVHETMDEHYMFYSGDGLMIADGNVIECHEGLFLLIPAGMPHELCALSDLKFMTIGVALGNRI